MTKPHESEEMDLQGAVAEPAHEQAAAADVGSTEEQAESADVESTQEQAATKLGRLSQRLQQLRWRGGTDFFRLHTLQDRLTERSEGQNRETCKESKPELTDHFNRSTGQSGAPFEPDYDDPAFPRPHGFQMGRSERMDSNSSGGSSPSGGSCPSSDSSRGGRSSRKRPRQDGAKVPSGKGNRDYHMALLAERAFHNPHSLDGMVQACRLQQALSFSVDASADAGDEHVYDLVRDRQNTAWADERVAKGVSLARKGQHQGAIAYYQQALELVPDHTPAIVARGAAHANQGALKQAVADFEKALQIDPNSANAQEYLDVARRKLGPRQSPISRLGTAPQAIGAAAPTSVPGGAAGGLGGGTAQKIGGVAQSVPVGAREARAAATSVAGYSYEFEEPGPPAAPRDGAESGARIKKVRMLLEAEVRSSKKRKKEHKKHKSRKKEEKKERKRRKDKKHRKSASKSKKARKSEEGSSESSGEGSSDEAASSAIAALASARSAQQQRIAVQASNSDEEAGPLPPGRDMLPAFVPAREASPQASAVEEGHPILQRPKSKLWGI